MQNHKQKIIIIIVIVQIPPTRSDQRGTPMHKIQKYTPGYIKLTLNMSENHVAPPKKIIKKSNMFIIKFTMGGYDV